MKNSASKATVLVGVALFIGACGGGGAELNPEIKAHLGAYENLIEKFEPRFDTVRNNPPEFAKVANSYKQETQAWMNEWKTVAPNLSDEQGRAIKAAIDKLNRRAERMLTGA